VAEKIEVGEDASYSCIRHVRLSSRVTSRHSFKR